MEIDLGKLQALLYEPSMHDPFIYKLLSVLQQNPTDDATTVVALAIEGMSKANAAYKEMVVKIMQQLPAPAKIGVLP